MQLLDFCLRVISHISLCIRSGSQSAKPRIDNSMRAIKNRMKSRNQFGDLGNVKPVTWE